MSKFIVTERMACWVTFTYEVEASDQHEALEEMYTVEPAVEVGDSIEAMGFPMLDVTESK